MLRVTTAGRAALADPNNVGVQAVRITRVLVGSGSGPGGAADDSRTTLRTQRDAAAAGGAVQVAARIAVRADVVGTAAYAVTEAGLEAAVGAGAAFLFAYWTNAGEVYAAVADGVAVLVVAAIDIVSGTPADLTVAIDPTVALSGATAFGALSDVPAGLVANSYYRASANGGRLDPVTRADVLSDLLTGLAGGTYPRVVEAGGVRSIEGLTASELLADLSALIPRADLAADLVIPDGAVWVDVLSLTVPAGWILVAGLTISSFSPRSKHARLLIGGAGLGLFLGSTAGTFGRAWQTAAGAAEVTATLQARQVGSGTTNAIYPTFLVALPPV